MHSIDILWHRVLRRPYTLTTIDEGEGHPVVLLHGLAASSRLWEPLIKLLRPKRRVLAIDLLGFGASPSPEWNDYDVEQHAKMVVATLKKRGVTKGAVLVGHSMGCLIATHIAARHPKLVDRLILYEPPLFADDPEYRSHAKRRERYFAFFAYIAAHPQWAFTQSYLMRITRRVIGLGVDKTTWVPFERSLRNTIMRQEAYDELRTIAVPTDIVHGRLDFVVIRTEVKIMFAANEHIKLHTVTDMHGLSGRSARYLARLLQQ
ncbi:MAG TPA: alpha/beta hydrolase [Candidatus Saccharimonadales bacterium]|nr:alpha/beta hydrolase [Candidatus Saccharimonadales bacterium]